MIVKGKLQGEWARLFPDYCYRTPVKQPVIWHDESRVYQDREYPRYTDVSQPNLKVIDLANYWAMAGRKKSDGMTTIEVYLERNEHTLAKRDTKIGEIEVSAFNMKTAKHLFDLAVERVIKEYKRGR